MRTYKVGSVFGAVVLLAGGLAYVSRDTERQTAAQRVAETNPAPTVLASLPRPSSPSAASSSPTRSPTPSKTTNGGKPKVTVTSKMTATCGAGLARIWASWPVPKGNDYTDLGDGTERDNVTCLVWQQAVPAGSFTFLAAKSYCAGLTLAGGGWHLPSRIELTSIIDASRSGPAIDTTAFPGTPAQFFWTSSPWAVTKEPLRAWIINFYEGLASNAAYQSGTFRVRCVRSTDGSGRPAYQISGGQVTDPATGLVWQRAASPLLTAAAADDYCATLTLGDRSWRLPSLRELSSTVDETRVAPAVDIDAFPETAKNAWYWTTTKAAPTPTQRWALNYNDGFTNYRKATTGYARCVSD